MSEGPHRHGAGLQLLVVMSTVDAGFRAAPGHNGGMQQSSNQASVELAVIGVGSIAEAIVTGLCAARPDRTIVLSPRGALRAARLAARHPGVWVAADNQTAVAAGATVLLCLRVQDAGPELGRLVFRPDQRVISVMPSPTEAQLADLIGPVAEICRGVPAVAVADRTGFTPVHPGGSVAHALFDELGTSMVLDDEGLLNATSVASATVAAWFDTLQTIADWLADTGVAAAQAQRLIGAVFAGAAADLRASSDFGALARQHATPGGQNERLALGLRRAGVLGAMTHELDDLLAGQAESAFD